MAEKDRADHQVISKASTQVVSIVTELDDSRPSVREMLYKLESFKAGTPEHASLLKSTMDILNRHVREEEQDDLPLLEHTLKVDESVSCHAKSFARTKIYPPGIISLTLARR